MTSSLRSVLLVQLPIPPPGCQPVIGNIPLAAGYLHLHARRQGLEEHYRFEILPPAMVNMLGDQALVAAILARRPWMVAFSCYVWNSERTLWIAARLKREQPTLKIVLGGPEIVADNAWLLREPPPGQGTLADYAVFGEGEQTFVELLAALRDGRSKPAIDGLWFPGRSNCPPRAPLADLERLMSPYVEEVLPPGPERSMFLETMRGCRWRCKYCYYPKQFEDVRFVSTEAVAAQLRWAQRNDIEEVVLLDPTLNQRPDFLDFLRLLAAENRERRFTYAGELRAEGIDAKTARLMRAANFKEVEIGLQTIEPQAQDLMGRHVDLPAFERGVKALLAEDITVRLDLILGLPGDTMESIRRGIDYLDRQRLFTQLQLFHLSILPGTEFRRDADKLGLDYQARPPYYVLQTPTLEMEQLRQLMDEAQDVFGVEFDAMPPPRLPEVGENDALRAGCIVNLDSPAAARALPPATQRAQVFTLCLRSADFAARRQDAARLIEDVLAENPHTTLEVVLEPQGDPLRVTCGVLERLLESCYRNPSYLDWYYSLHPGQLMGAKRLVVLIPARERRRAGQQWIGDVSQYAWLLWWGSGGDGEPLAPHEQRIADRPAWLRK
jgi:radical SAM superfamily enzyme YgiQ (UPF0313 family)